MVLQKNKEGKRYMQPADVDVVGISPSEKQSSYFLK